MGKNRLKTLALHIFFVLAATIFLLHLQDSWVSAGGPYEVPLDGGSRYGSQCYGGKEDYYVDVPSSYSGSKILLKAEGTSNPSSCADLGVDLCGWKESCYVDVMPGQRVSFQVSWHCGYCGDYESEDWTIEADFVSGPVCGNGKCESGETCSSCSSDCGSCKKSNGSSCDYSSECSGGYCVHYKCRSSATYCGDGYCDSGENCYYCSSDCSCSSSQCCYLSSSNADSKGCVSSGYKTSSSYICCSGARYAGNCCSSSDCDTGYTCSNYKCLKSSYCGDGKCDSGESCSSCSSDCGGCEPVCGNGKCENGESYSNCAKDCYTYSHSIGGGCSIYQQCVGSNCASVEECPQEETVKKTNGEYCDKNEECKSANCQNYRCCVKGKKCCFSHNHCGLDDYCSSFYHFCEPAKPLGQKCAEDNECLSNTCGDEVKICCEYGQVCCQNHSDCRDSEYCEQGTYYCRYKWQIGEKCGDYGSDMCASGYCDSETWTCAEKPEDIKEEAAPSAQKEKTACGNKNCEYWLNENCENCPADCDFENTCCEPEKSFMYPSNYQNKIYKLQEAPGGIVPSGTFVVPKGFLETTFFSEYTPQMCGNGEVIKGKCINNWDCPEGVCSKDFQCVETTSEEFKKVEDEELAQKIYEKQTDYREKFNETYNKIKDDISSCAAWKGLKMCLEVQGKSAAKDKLAGLKAEPILAILNIENISDYNIAVIPEISFSDGVRFEAKEYNMGLSWSGGLRSILGSFMTGVAKIIMGGKYLVMPPHSKAVVYSRIIPKETGILDAFGTVYSTTDEEFADNKPGLIDIILKPEQYETNFEKTEVSKQITIKEKPCGWLFCL